VTIERKIKSRRIVVALISVDIGISHSLLK
jgi:hypothetical protein